MTQEEKAERHREYIRNWTREHRELQREYNRKWRENNKQHIREARARYNQKRKAVIDKVKRMMEGEPQQQPQELTRNQRRYQARREKALAYAKEHYSREENAKKARRHYEKQKQLYELSKTMTD